MRRSEERPSVRQERAELPAWGVYGFAAFILVLLVAGGVVTALIEPGASFRTGWRREAAGRTGPRTVEGIEQTPLPSGTAPATPGRTGREALSRYEWVDREHGIVRIPVERAMEMLVDRGHVE
jgi:hypothetical protein